MTDLFNSCNAMQYFPITAVQSWTPASRTFQNGVFFGRILSLVFVGPYATKGVSG